MIKILYLVIVLLLLLPSVLAAVVSVQSARRIDRIQHDVQRHTSDSVYVLGHSTMALGRTRVDIYPHTWAAVSLLLSVILWFVATLFLFFVRP